MRVTQRCSAHGLPFGLRWPPQQCQPLPPGDQLSDRWRRQTIWEARQCQGSLQSYGNRVTQPLLSKPPVLLWEAPGRTTPADTEPPGGPSQGQAPGPGWRPRRAGVPCSGVAARETGGHRSADPSPARCRQPTVAEAVPTGTLRAGGRVAPWQERGGFWERHQGCKGGAGWTHIGYGTRKRAQRSGRKTADRGTQGSPSERPEDVGDFPTGTGESCRF